MSLTLHKNCKSLLEAFKSGKLGQTVMPEDSNPGFSDKDAEMRIAYFTLPMALNYQRDSYKLWEAALKTFNDSETKFVFDVVKVSKASEDDVRKALMKYKVALQPNKHINTWRTIAKTIANNWGSFTKFFEATQNDFLKLKQIVIIEHKKGFPYLSGPKIFNYWSFIISTYGGIKLTNRDHIEIAPDTHITQCSVKLGVITKEEAELLTKDAISERWRELLKESGIDPIDMHPPLWFWSRNGFVFEINPSETRTEKRV
ncbi:MAG: hypothetical protein RL094_352 [Candidatus Parcubacteria bacterium]|jgi:hypothetical protein